MSPTRTPVRLTGTVLARCSTIFAPVEPRMAQPTATNRAFQRMRRASWASFSATSICPRTIRAERSFARTSTHSRGESRVKASFSFVSCRISISTARIASGDSRTSRAPKRRSFVTHPK